AIELTTDIQDVTCSGGSDGSAAITGVGNAVGQVSYLWSNANTTTQINSAAAGNFTVTVTDSKGCTVVQNLQIEEPEPIDLAFDIQPLICAADSNAAISVIASGGIPGYQYLWSNQATSNAISGLRAGVYGVTVTDSNGCTSIGNQIIELPGALQVSTELDDPLCFGAKNGRIHLVVSGGAVPYKYRINDEPFSGSSTFLALGAGIYNMEVTDGNGCQAFIVDTLNQPQPVIAQLPADTTLIFGDSLWITASAMNITGLPEFTWTSNLVEQISCTDSAYCDEIFIKPILSNVYRVKVTDENGCTGTATITVNVKKPKGIYVPTGFSPNGDQNNDVLVVHGLSRQVRKIVSFRLFDRWGELVYQDQDFSVNDQGRGWDGTFRGQPCDPGVYVWILEGLYEDGYTENLKGEVTLIR
ncbi:MAG: gliding motility-associated C-terminal domain-containing protein, partial [Saprospiraceae bacterium]|nr:gliding motility-associated C-terminal domain-containing protein [Saprospiraceae bacterium]